MSAIAPSPFSVSEVHKPGEKEALTSLMALWSAKASKIPRDCLSMAELSLVLGAASVIGLMAETKFATDTILVAKREAQVHAVAICSMTRGRCQLKFLVSDPANLRLAFRPSAVRGAGAAIILYLEKKVPEIHVHALTPSLPFYHKMGFLADFASHFGITAMTLGKTIMIIKTADNRRTVVKIMNLWKDMAKEPELYQRAVLKSQEREISVATVLDGAKKVQAVALYTFGKGCCDLKYLVANPENQINPRKVRGAGSSAVAYLAAKYMQIVAPLSPFFEKCGFVPKEGKAVLDKGALTLELPPPLVDDETPLAL